MILSLPKVHIQNNTLRVTENIFWIQGIGVRRDRGGEERGGEAEIIYLNPRIFIPSHTFFPLKGQTLGKAFIQWVCTQRLKTLWQELRGRNLRLRDWAGWPDRSHPRNANSAHYRPSFFLGWFGKIRLQGGKTDFAPYVTSKLCRDADV